ncbi:Hypothetical protein AA314_00291 [Archangium gephyra]|uniref:Uncharacterized protein n=1 Tax=Archangium gephyra TaxID=48 RepID=A0AAC8TA77_9BACT|nr:Hypothetical protein AA314_00291 [Archangium gephyra]
MVALPLQSVRPGLVGGTAVPGRWSTSLNGWGLPVRTCRGAQAGGRAGEPSGGRCWDGAGFGARSCPGPPRWRGA